MDNKVKFLPAIAILSLTLLAAISLFKGIDGAILATITALIAGLGGYTASKVL